MAGPVNPTHCPDCSTELTRVTRVKRPGFLIKSRLLECKQCGWFEQRQREYTPRKEKASV